MPPEADTFLRQKSTPSAASDSNYAPSAASASNYAGGLMNMSIGDEPLRHDPPLPDRGHDTPLPDLAGHLVPEQIPVRLVVQTVGGHMNGGGEGETERWASASMCISGADDENSADTHDDAGGSSRPAFRFPPGELPIQVRECDFHVSQVLGSGGRGSQFHDRGYHAREPTMIPATASGYYGTASSSVPGVGDVGDGDVEARTTNDAASGSAAAATPNEAASRTRQVSNEQVSNEQPTEDRLSNESSSFGLLARNRQISDESQAPIASAFSPTRQISDESLAPIASTFSPTRQISDESKTSTLSLGNQSAEETSSEEVEGMTEPPVPRNQADVRRVLPSTIELLRLERSAAGSEPSDQATTGVKQQPFWVRKETTNVAWVYDYDERLVEQEAFSTYLLLAPAERVLCEGRDGGGDDSGSSSCDSDCEWRSDSLSRSDLEADTRQGSHVGKNPSPMSEKIHPLSLQAKTTRVVPYEKPAKVPASDDLLTPDGVSSVHAFSRGSSSESSVAAGRAVGALDDARSGLGANIPGAQEEVEEHHVETPENVVTSLNTEEVNAPGVQPTHGQETGAGAGGVLSRFLYSDAVVTGDVDHDSSAGWRGAGSASASTSRRREAISGCGASIEIKGRGEEPLSKKPLSEQKHPVPGTAGSEQVLAHVPFKIGVGASSCSGRVLIHRDAAAAGAAASTARPYDGVMGARSDGSPGLPKRRKPLQEVENELADAGIAGETCQHRPADGLSADLRRRRDALLALRSGGVVRGKPGRDPTPFLLIDQERIRDMLREEAARADDEREKRSKRKKTYFPPKAPGCTFGDTKTTRDGKVFIWKSTRKHKNGTWVDKDWTAKIVAKRQVAVNQRIEKARATLKEQHPDPTDGKLVSLDGFSYRFSAAGGGIWKGAKFSDSASSGWGAETSAVEERCAA
eukprot:g19455.t1